MEGSWHQHLLTRPSLASASDDKTIKLWDPYTGEHLRTLEGHSEWVMSVTFSPDGGLLASASSDKTIKLWDSHTGKHLRTLQGHPYPVTSVAFSPNGGLIASASYKTIKLWDPDTGEDLRTLQGHSELVESVAFPPDGGLMGLASSDSLKPMTSSLCIHSMDVQGHALIHDAYTGQLVQTQGKFSFPVAGGDQIFLTLENQWVCHGMAHIFHFPSSFSISTWKQRGSLVCFGSQTGQVLFLDISDAINILSMM